MLVAFKKSGHQKYLTKDSATPPTASAAAAQAASSTHTMDTAASEQDEPASPAGPDADSADEEEVGGGPVPMTLPVDTAVGYDAHSDARRSPPAVMYEDTVTDFVDEQEHAQSGLSRAFSESFDPVSDLSLSSRDIRY
jgi:hypothetical protein